MRKMLILFAAGLGAAPLSSVMSQPASKPGELTVTLSNFAYQPAQIQLAAGRPVTLRFVNAAGGGHDFTAPAFFATSQILAGAAPGGQVSLHGHESRTVTLIPRAGTYRVRCTHFLHKQMGMRGTIQVG